MHYIKTELRVGNSLCSRASRCFWSLVTHQNPKLKKATQNPKLSQSILERPNSNLELSIEPNAASFLHYQVTPFSLSSLPLSYGLHLGFCVQHLEIRVYSLLLLLHYLSSHLRSDSMFVSESNGYRIACNICSHFFRISF